MISESSSADHLLCFLAGESELCGGIVRLAPGKAPTPTLCKPGKPGRAAYTDGRTAGPADVAVVVGMDGDDVRWVADAEDSFESEALRSEAISTVTVSRRLCVEGC